jgi:hypothetical protein
MPRWECWLLIRVYTLPMNTAEHRASLFNTDTLHGDVLIGYECEWYGIVDVITAVTFNNDHSNKPTKHRAKLTLEALILA